MAPKLTKIRERAIAREQFGTAETKLLRHGSRGLSMTLLFFARVVELVDTQVSEACA